MTQRRHIWLHVGLPKTATTSVQAWFRSHSDDLLSQGISYPRLFGAGNDKHSFLVGALKQDPELKQLDALLHKNTSPTLILSDEGLTNHLDDFNPKALERFRNLTRDFKVGVILVSREEASWVRSYHKQCVLNPNNGASPLWGTAMTVSDLSSHKRIKRLMNSARLSKDLKNAFGAETVETFRFEDSQWFEKVLKRVGAGALVPAKLPAVNESLPDWSIELLRQVNALAPAQSVRNKWKHALQTHLQTNHTTLTKLKPLNPPAVSPAIYMALRNNLSSFQPSDRALVSNFLENLMRR